MNLRRASDAGEAALVWLALFFFGLTVRYSTTLVCFFRCGKSRNPEADKLDRFMLEQIHQFSPEGVLRAEKEGTGSACGNGALAAVLWTARELGASSVTMKSGTTSYRAADELNTTRLYPSRCRV